MPNPFPAVILEQREPKWVCGGYSNRIRDPFIQLGQHFGYNSLCIYFDTTGSGEKTRAFSNQEVFYDETGRSSEHAIIPKEDVHIMLDGSVSYSGPLQTGEMENYYGQVVGESVFAMLEGLYRTVCGNSIGTIAQRDAESIFQVFKLVFCDKEPEDKLMFWSKCIKARKNDVDSANAYHLDRPYGNRDYTGLGIEGFSCRLMDVYALWMNAVKEYGKDCYERTLEKSDLGNMIGIFDWATEELGIRPMLDALYSGVPIGDIIA